MIDDRCKRQGENMLYRKKFWKIYLNTDNNCLLYLLMVSVIYCYITNFPDLNSLILLADSLTWLAWTVLLSSPFVHLCSAVGQQGSAFMAWLVISWRNRGEGDQIMFLSFSCRLARHVYTMVSNFQEKHQYISTFQTSVCLTFAAIAWPGAVSIGGTEQWWSHLRGKQIGALIATLPKSWRQLMGCREHGMWGLASQS